MHKKIEMKFKSWDQNVNLYEESLSILAYEDNESRDLKT